MDRTNVRRSNYTGIRLTQYDTLKAQYGRVRDIPNASIADLDRRETRARAETRRREEKREREIQAEVARQMEVMRQREAEGKKLRKEKREALKLNEERYVINKTTGDIFKFKLNDKPLLSKEFGIKTIPSALIKAGGSEFKKEFEVYKDGIPLDKRVSGVLEATITARHESSNNVWKPKVITSIENVKIKDNENLNKIVMDDAVMFHPLLKNPEWIIESIQVKFKNKSNVSFDLTDMKLRDVAPLNITSIYGETIEMIRSDDNCVRTYIKDEYHKNGKGVGKKAIEKLGDKDGVSAKELHAFCSQYSIKMVLFDIVGNIVMSYYPEKKNKKFKSLIAVIYNNHIYPLKNKELHKVATKKVDEEVYCENMDEKLIQFLNEGVHPDKVNLYGTAISSFQIDKKLYHSNAETEKMKTILNKLGLSDKATAFMSINNIDEVIEKLFLQESINSYFPYLSQEGGYNYFNEEIEGEFITIDHNKHYAEALRTLPYLITCDIRTAKHIMNPTELKDGYLYIATPFTSTILMPKTGYYDYQYLRYCQNEGVQFTLNEAISCSKSSNYFEALINTLYEKLSEDEFKDIYVRLIGKFEYTNPIKQKSTFVKIANKDETEATAGYIHPVGKYNIIFDVKEECADIYNRVPIRIQTLCNARKLVYEKMKELKLTGDDIKQVKTDAITFVKNQLYIKNEKGMGGWKVENKLNLFKNEFVPYDKDITFVKTANNNNVIFEDYAGSGKTHHIVNNLIPELRALYIATQVVPELDDYIVISPSHASIKTYRQLKINCNVIQTYTYSGEVPKEKNIIVDEIGMVSETQNVVLIKSMLLGKNIYSFGDFKQLKPVDGERCNGEIYLNYMYKTRTKLGTNYRKDFSFEYYDKLMTMEGAEIVNEILKYNTKNYYDADTIVCYTNEVRAKYNALMMERLGVEFGDEGCKVVCKSNKMRKYNMFNNFYYTIKSNDGGKVVLTDDVDDIEIKEEELKYFEPGYCRTLYNIQGESTKSFYFPMEDINYMDGTALYTLISRLRK
jgi:hypothetical protein